MAIMATMAVMAWQGLDAMARTRAMVVDRQDKVTLVNVGLQQWAQDLDMMVETPPLSIIDWDGRVLRIVRRNAASEPEGLLVAAWTRSVLDEGGQAHWLRWQSKPVTTSAQLSQAFDQAGIWAQSAGNSRNQQDVVIVPLESWQIYFYRRGAWTNPLSVDLEPGANRVTRFSTNSIIGGAAINSIRLVLTLPPGHPMGGTLTRDWVRPTLSDGKS